MSNVLTLLARRSIMKEAQQAETPYTYYDYIQCNDTSGDSYINTGLIPNRSTAWTFEGKFARTTSLPSNYYMRCVFSRFNTGSNNCNYFLGRYKNSTGGALAFNYNGKIDSQANSGQPTTTATIGVWLDFELKATSGVTYGGTLVIGEETKDYTSATPNSEATTTLKVLWGYPCRLARFKVYVSGTLKADLVPAMRNSDNAIGMWDVVRETFYTPTGSATFTVGNGLENFNT